VKRLCVVALCACSGAQPLPPVAVTPVMPDARPSPWSIEVPTGWTDLIAAPRDEVEKVAPGMWDQVHAMAQRDGYAMLAQPLDPASPDRGSQMTLLALGEPGPVDQALLDRFVAGNNLGLTAAELVERKLVAVRGRALAKLRAEYDGAQMKIDTIAYLFADDDGIVRELVFTVRASRYEALRAELESIEAGAIVGP
jgi:hypothetical protein